MFGSGCSGCCAFVHFGRGGKQFDPRYGSLFRVRVIYRAAAIPPPPTGMETRPGLPPDIMVLNYDLQECATFCTTAYVFHNGGEPMGRKLKARHRREAPSSGAAPAIRSAFRRAYCGR